MFWGGDFCGNGRREAFSSHWPSLDVGYPAILSAFEPLPSPKVIDGYQDNEIHACISDSATDLLYDLHQVTSTLQPIFSVLQNGGGLSSYGPAPPTGQCRQAVIPMDCLTGFTGYNHCFCPGTGECPGWLPLSLVLLGLIFFRIVELLQVFHFMKSCKLR